MRDLVDTRIARIDVYEMNKEVNGIEIYYEVDGGVTFFKIHYSVMHHEKDSVKSLMLGAKKAAPEKQRNISKKVISIS